MPQLIVEVKDRIARGNKERIVCGNSDYTIKFEFDEMWDAYPTKTALYKWGEEFKESERVPFEGDVCRVPKMLNTSGFKVGVYAGDLCSTTPAYFGADQSILCNTTEQDPPAPDIYNEIMELINKKAGGDPTLIRKVFTDVVESGELIYNWAVIPNKYIFRDVVIGGTPDEPGEDVIVTPEQMPVYGEDLIIEIEGTPYQARWLSENAIDNGGGDAWVSLNDDGTVTVGGMIGNWVVSLYKASDISPVIIPRDHIPEEQDPTVEDWAKKQEVKYVFRDIHLPSGVYSTVITPEVMPTYGDELIIRAEGLFDAKRATWLSETTIDNGVGDLTAYIHEDGTMTISSMMDGVTAYLYYPTEKSVVPADRLPVVDWAIDEDPFVFKDIIIPSGDNQEVTITPNRIPKNGDILMMKVGFNYRDAKWESASRIVAGEEAWAQINDDGTITIGSMSGNTSLSLHYGSIGQSKANLIFSEQDPTVEDWAKTNLTYYFRAYIPMDENWNVYEVRIPYITNPSLGDSAVVRISAGSWYNTCDATFTENGWEFSDPYFTADHWISDNEDGTVTIGSMSGDIYMEMYKSIPKDVSVPASKLPIATNDSLGAVKPVSRENNMSQPVGVGIDGRLWTIGYTLPVAEVATLGGVKPVTATAEMTQPVGVDAAGALYTAPGASGGGGAQSDFSQNDPTADDYIKNRTHWKEPKTEVIPETSIEISNVGQPTIAPFILEIQEGCTYEVTWNGNVYQCVAYIIEAEDVNISAIGNATIAYLTGGNDEPFFIANAQGNTLVFAEEAGTHTVSISGEIITWHTLDRRYLPNSVATTDDVHRVENAVNRVAVDVANVATTVNNRMNKRDPVGTGSFSMNRKAGTTIGGYSHAEGYDATASGNYSHAEGASTTASGIFSHAEGRGTIAAGDYSHAQGKYNVEDTENKYAHIVGNGTDEYKSTRSNAHTLDWDGNAWFAGTVYVGGTSQDDGDRLIRLSEQMTEDDALELLAETGIIDPITNENGAVFTDENGAIYVL